MRVKKFYILLPLLLLVGVVPIACAVRFWVDLAIFVIVHIDWCHL